MSVATFHVVRYPPAYRGTAASRMYLDRAPLRNTSGLQFWRLLGTARGRSMSLSVDPDRWAMFAVWDDERALATFLATSDIAARWHREASEACTVRLAYGGGHGLWGGVFPFAGERPASLAGAPVAVLTRAAIRFRRLPRFYRAVPAIETLLAGQAGVRRSLGAGEWPLARQATFSLWEDHAAVTAFAWEGSAHREVIRRTRREDW
ncbi:MAG TPA: monooxygenase [Mycobacteriales bacterium]|nr:monooxygenase [Mycobacteriales bacterium]